MKKFYHTGFDSYEYPQIKSFGEDEIPESEGFSWGPFETFSIAKLDFLFHVEAQIENLKTLRHLVKKLEKGTADANKK
jgi:hypothetical protein